MQIDIQQKPKTFIVVNPVAGVSQSETVREKIEFALQAKEIPFEVYETTGNDNFKQIIRNAVQQGFKLVIVAGWRWDAFGCCGWPGGYADPSSHPSHRYMECPGAGIEYPTSIRCRHGTVISGTSHSNH